MEKASLLVGPYVLDIHLFLVYEYDECGRVYVAHR